MLTLRLLAALALLFPLCPAQQPQPEDSLATFGTTVIIPGGLKGSVYFIEPTGSLPDFRRLTPVGTLYTKGLFIKPREFREGFPGIGDRVEWFAIDFTGRFYVEKPGNYRFLLASDDGAKLYIDQKLVLNNDGIHPTSVTQTVLALSGGAHAIRLSYFQGPRYELSLMLSVKGPGDFRFHPFNTDKFKPPSNPENWKYGSPADWNEPERKP